MRHQEPRYRDSRRSFSMNRLLDHAGARRGADRGVNPRSLNLPASEHDSSRETSERPSDRA